MAGNSSFDLSVVIPSWNGLELLRENLPSILEAATFYRRETGGRTEILVVDDGSRDGTQAALAAEFPQVRVIRRDVNGGFAKACNSGFAECACPIVALLNNDVRIESKYLYYQALHFQDPDVFAVTARVFEWDQPIFATGGKVGRFRRGFWSAYFNYDARLDDAGKWIDGRRLLAFYAVGGFAAFDRSKLSRLDGFNELLSPFHWEDIDLSYRGWKSGWEVRYEPRSVAFHRTSATIDAHYARSKVERAAWRNRLLFHWINLHDPMLALFHAGMTAALLLSRIWVLDLTFYQAFWDALRQLGDARKRRALERRRSVRTDREIDRRLQAFYRTAPIEIFYNRSEVIRSHWGPPTEGGAHQHDS